jgi:hypothetical protein
MPRDPAEPIFFSLSHFPYAALSQFVIRKAQQINPGRRPDHNLDRNGVDDGTGATAAIGATDIHPRDDSSGTGRPHSNRAGIVGSLDQRKL